MRPARPSHHVRKARRQRARHRGAALACMAVCLPSGVFAAYLAGRGILDAGETALDLAPELYAAKVCAALLIAMALLGVAILAAWEARP